MSRDSTHVAFLDDSTQVFEIEVSRDSTQVFMIEVSHESFGVNQSIWVKLGLKRTQCRFLGIEIQSAAFTRGRQSLLNPPLGE